MPGRRTRIDAGHIIAYQDGGHRYLKDGNTARPFMEESVPTDR